MKRALLLLLLGSLLLPAAASAGGFRPLSPMNSPRIDPVVVELQDGRVLVAGGHRGPEGSTRKAEIYNPQSLAWENTGSLHQARTGASGTLLPDGRVLVVGGKLGRQSIWSPMASAEIFNPATNSFSPLSSKPLARAYGAGALIGDEVLLWGGYNGSGQEPVSQIFSPATGTFRSAGLPRPQLWGGEVNLFSGSAFRIGGWQIGRPTRAVLRYDGSWQATAPLLQARGDAAGVVMPGGDLLVAGGWGSGKALRSTEIYRNGSWRKSRRLLEPRLGADMVLSGGKPILLSGWIGGRSTDRTEVLTTRGWKRGPRMMYARWGASAWRLPQGQILLLGGMGRKGVLRQSEVYDPRLRAPWVDIKQAPPRKTKKRVARFRFEIDGRGRIECKLDRARWRQCGRKPSFRVDPGKHRLQVRSRVWKLFSPATSWRWQVNP